MLITTDDQKTYTTEPEKSPAMQRHRIICQIVLLIPNKRTKTLIPAEQMTSTGFLPCLSWSYISGKNKGQDSRARVYRKSAPEDHGAHLDKGEHGLDQACVEANFLLWY